ncbi:ABC transporter ATP-binding protein [Paenibacillus sp. MMS20-IR301]|uniref:ABC transporter ATP-binding protein n=1 Tax=Paenibacillus sp. MMS20-IR301 TaxID=2895946 RepID=UPI0028EF6CE3|nr:ABC transporter ATP-binding protein [Paenibacillus sp. MMS20-IR301]WNS46681.1 ABC transporter ATP-binding protein [Paenibacillus sp. MMS20-IR301]
MRESQAVAGGVTPLLEISNLQKSYGDYQALSSLNLAMQEGEIISVLGPSGCGKSTLLQLVAGLSRPDGGEIRLHGKSIATASKMLPPEKRGINMVFQDYALWPHMNVFDNVAYGLKEKRLPAQQIKDKVAGALALLQLEGFERRLPPQLSGGQQQRVAIARALVTEPRLMLLDEPLSNLDMRLRVEMRTEMSVLFRRLKMSVFHVTHDPEEAFAMADKLLLMRSGAIDQFDTPYACYHKPASRQAASLLGAINVLQGEPAGTAADPVIRCSAGLLSGTLCGPGSQWSAGGRAELRFRPEAVTLLPAETPAASEESADKKLNVLEASVIHCTFEGTKWRILAETPAHERIYLFSEDGLEAGRVIRMQLPDHAAYLYGL